MDALLLARPGLALSQLLFASPETKPTWLEALEIVVWPVVVVGVLVFLYSPRGRALVAPLAKRLSGIEAFGVKLDFTVEGANKVRENLEDTFSSYRADVQKYFDRLARECNIRSLHAKVVGEVKDLVSAAGQADFRSTLHVQDLLFADALYQLLDYFPSAGGAGSRTRGRIFSIRFGILGKAWRSETCRAQGHVSTDPEELISGWGMTKNEAVVASGRGRQSFACVIVRDRRQNPLGVLYFDSQQIDAFGADEGARNAFVAAVETAASRELAGALRKLVRETRKRGPEVKIFDDA